MDHSLPGIILSGASGFVGRHFIKAAEGKYRLFCIARRSMTESGVQPSPNLRWSQIDIAEWDKLKELAQRIHDHGGVDYVVNLAGYYDFTNRDHPEYQRTNVQGTRNMLELARCLAIKRFLFASSQAACAFGQVVYEHTPAEAEIPYGRSKREGERLVREYSQYFPCAIVRIAAVFSDWCEYPPLYALLNNWLSGKFLETRLIAGAGRSAVPYIHVHDLVHFFLRVIEKDAVLGSLCTLNAGPDGGVSHLELFRVATQFYYQRQIKPIFVGKALLKPMILARQMQSRVLHGKEAFEQTWMADFIDQQLIADSSHTRRLLDWRPSLRKSILRRLLFLIENMKQAPELWLAWNEAMLRKTAQRPYLALHDALCQRLHSHRELIIDAALSQLLPPSEQSLGCGPTLAKMEPPLLRSYLRLLQHLIITVVCTRDRPMMRRYAHTIAFMPMSLGVDPQCASHCLFVLGERGIELLRGLPEFQSHGAVMDDYIGMTIHLALDQIEDQAELARLQSPQLEEQLRSAPLPKDSETLEAIGAELDELRREAASGKSWTSPLVQP